MDNLPLILIIAQIAVSIILVVLILLQDSSEVSGIFGGGNQGFYQTKRGVEKGVFVTTIVFTIIFATLALLNLVLPNLQNLF